MEILNTDSHEIAGYLLGTHLAVRYCAWNLFRRVPARVMSYSYDLRAAFTAQTRV